MDSSLCNTSQALSFSENMSCEFDGNENLSLIIHDSGPVIPPIVITVLLSISSIIAVFGNTLVIVAFIVDKRLRNHSCYFLLNLAICDFVVGSISMPWYIPYLHTGRWSMGRAFCKVWGVVDATVCVSSVYTILLISYDRFLSVTKAVSYRALQGTTSLVNKTFMQIGLTWLVSFMFSPPAIVFWDIATGQSIVPDGVCAYELANAWNFLIFLEVLFFYIPFIGVAYFNVSIYWNIRQRNKLKLISQKQQQTSPLSTISSIQEETEEKTNHVAPLSFMMRKCILDLNKCQNRTLKGAERKISKISPAEDIATSSHQENSSVSTINLALQAKLRKDKKIAKYLAIIVGVYCTCWAPYTLMLNIRAICQGSCVPTYLFDLMLCFLWMNSAINPFLYPFCHKKFRTAFKKVFHYIV